MDKKRVESYIKSVGNDFRAIKFKDDGRAIRLRIGKFFISRDITDDYDYDVKKLMEDFLTNTSTYYIKNFWEI
jgi:hypothetical protein